MSHLIVSNIVEKDKFREVQKDTLEYLSNCLIKSFGPHGSNSTIGNNGFAVEYTKDGKSILDHIQFMGVIENCIRQDLSSITRQVVKQVGDGTTSAILLSNEIFKGLTELDNDKNISSAPPYTIISEFKSIVNDLIKIIESNRSEMTLEKVRDIAHVSTNGNDTLTEYIVAIYEKYGLDVFVDVGVSLNENTIIKHMDGMNLESGLLDSAFINTTKNTCEIMRPKIYAFKDPIDTAEMSSLFDEIISSNIASHIEDGNYIPTVILAPKISRDVSYYMNNILSSFNSLPIANRPPLLIIDGIFETDKFEDIIKMCGCKTFNKYIDPEQKKRDIELGLAPTRENLHEFAGECEMISSDASKTKFINPSKMKDDNGNYTIEYKSLLDFINKELNRSIEEGENANVIGTYRRRLQSLKGNLVDFLIGGISAADRDSDRDLVEDAILNIRSAVKYGYGRAANYEGFNAIMKYLEEDKNKDNPIANIIKNAYVNLIYKLYINSGIILEEPLKYYEKGVPFNIRTSDYDYNGQIISSIKTDIVILESISKIITLMFTSNQFICNDISMNIYR